MSLGVFAGHPGGVASMAIVADRLTTHSSVIAAPSHELEYGLARDTGDAGGLLVTCGKVEGIVKIWDYTYVGEGGVCGRYAPLARGLKLLLTIRKKMATLNHGPPSGRVWYGIQGSPCRNHLRSCL